MSTVRSYRVVRWDDECRQWTLVDVGGATIHAMLLYFLDAVRALPNKVDLFVKMSSRPTVYNKKGWFSDDRFASFATKIVKAVKACKGNVIKAQNKVDEFRRELL